MKLVNTATGEALNIRMNPDCKSPDFEDWIDGGTYPLVIITDDEGLEFHLNTNSFRGFNVPFDLRLALFGSKYGSTERWFGGEFHYES